MNNEPYTSKETDYNKTHPVAARLREEGAREYEENREYYELLEEEFQKEYIEEYEKGLG